MLFLPHSTDLKLARRPYVTYAVIIICLFIHYLQQQNREQVALAAADYCELINYSNGGRSIHGLVDVVPELKPRNFDFLREEKGHCQTSLASWHEQPDKENIKRFLERSLNVYVKNEVELIFERLAGVDSAAQRLTQEQVAAIVQQAEAHYRSFATNAPGSLDEKLMYDPASLNPMRMITSSLAHADWGHIVFNLIFFFAFAPALEVMCLHWLRYVGVLLTISIATSVSYSLFSLGSIPVPGLGLSGVVMGMMGLSAYMMPWARIRTFVWFFTLVKNFYIPAWILAVFYIGSDLLTLFDSGNSGGINVVAHVSGGISGYLIGRFWLKRQKEEVQDELKEEMEVRSAMRNDVMRSGSTSRAGQQRMVDQRREYQAKRDYQAVLDRLHILMNSGQDSDAVVLFLQEYEDYAQQPEIYDELFEEFMKWRAGRATLCLGRLDITLLLKAGKTTRALEVVKSCQQLSREFVLATPRQNGILLKAALARREYELAYGLLHDAAARYGVSIDRNRYHLMEAQLLIQHLQRYDEARPLLTLMLADAGNPYREQAQKMADYIEKMA